MRGGGALSGPLPRRTVWEWRHPSAPQTRLRAGVRGALSAPAAAERGEVAAEYFPVGKASGKYFASLYKYSACISRENMLKYTRTTYWRMSTGERRAERSPTKGVTRTGAGRRDCGRTKFWRTPRRARMPKVQAVDPVNLSGERTERQRLFPRRRQGRGRGWPSVF